MARKVTTQRNSGRLHLVAGGRGSTEPQSLGARVSGSRILPPDVLPRALVQADQELAAAAQASDWAEQFRHAHLAALRSAAAIIEFRGRPSPRSGARTVWEMLAIVEPELAPWSAYFASGAPLRAKVEAGYEDAIDAVRAAEVVACAEDFREEVAQLFDARQSAVQLSFPLDGALAA